MTPLDYLEAIEFCLAATPNFPHHVHIGVDDQVEASERMSILDLIGLLEKELDKTL